MRKKAISLLALFAAFISMTLVSTFNNHFTLAANIEVPSEVTIGTEINVSMIDIEHNGEIKKASSLVVHTPTGSTFSSTKVSFDEPGKYVFEFSALFGEEKITKTKETMSIRTPISMFDASNASISQESFAHKLDESVGTEYYKGIKVNSRDGGTVTFNKILDFSQSTKDDAFIDFIVEPSTPGSYDAGEVVITLTDADNPTNKVDIRFVDGLAGSGGFTRLTYASARATGQNYSGYENWNQQWHINADQTGAPTFLTLRGLDKQQIGTIGYLNSQLFFDYSNKQIFTKSEYSYVDSKVLISDLDSTNVYPTNPWSGFKNNRAILSFTTNDVSGAGAKYIIKSIFGYDFSNDLLRDTTAPKLSIDFDGYNREDLPLAKKGNTYPLFSNNVFDDFDDDLYLNTKVQFYDSDKQVYIDVANDGARFITNYFGKYIVSYYCSDRSGNDVEDSYIVNCSSIIKNIEMIIPEDTATHRAFEKVELCSLNDVVVNNAQGKVELCRYLVSPDSSEIKLEDDYFTPTNVGAYKVKYIASDIYQNPVTKTVTYNIKNIEHPIIIEQIILPSTVIKGQYLELPRVGCKYPSGNKIVDGEVDIYVNGTLFKEDKFLAKTLGKISIDCVPHSSTENKQSFVVKVVEGNDENGKIIKENYFSSTDSSYGAESVKNKAMQFTASSDAKINFIKSIASNELSFSFSLEEETISNYEGFAIKISDKYDVNKTLTLKVVPFGNGLKLYVPFDKLSKDLDCDSSRQFEIYYRSYYKTLRDRNYKEICEIKYFDNGDSFTGFSEEVYLSFGFVGLTEPAKASLIFINNQSFKTSIAKDNAGPQIITDSNLNWANELGAEITISNAKAFDVLSSVECLYVTMTGPDGAKILDNADASIDHKVVLNKYGNYRIEYNSKDGNGRTSNRSFTICCIENEPPELTVNFNPKEQYSVNSVFTLPTYSFNDNSKNCTLEVTLYLPDGQGIAIEHVSMIEGEIFKENYLDLDHYSEELVKSNNSIKLFMTGKFILRYLVIDAYGNVNYREFVLNVR